MEGGSGTGAMPCETWDTQEQNCHSQIGCIYESGSKRCISDPDSIGHLSCNEYRQYDVCVSQKACVWDSSSDVPTEQGFSSIFYVFIIFSSIVVFLFIVILILGLKR